MRLGLGAAGCALAAILTAQAASAQGRSEEQPTPLRFTPGQQCIDYRGKASLFTLPLEGGQKIVATATGVASGGPGAASWLTMREPSLIARSIGQKVHFDKGSEAVVPASGAYDILLFPMSEAGNPGELLICKVRATG